MKNTYFGLPWWLSGKEPAFNAGDQGSIPGLGRSPGGGHGNPLQYSCLENSVDRGAWQATVHRVAESQIWLKRLSSSGIYISCVYSEFLSIMFNICSSGSFISLMCYMSHLFKLVSEYIITEISVLQLMDIYIGFSLAIRNNAVWVFSTYLLGYMSKYLSGTNQEVKLSTQGLWATSALLVIVKLFFKEVVPTYIFTNKVFLCIHILANTYHQMFSFLLVSLVWIV